MLYSVITFGVKVVTTSLELSNMHIHTHTPTPTHTPPHPPPHIHTHTHHPLEKHALSARITNLILYVPLGTNDLLALRSGIVKLHLSITQIYYL